MVAHVLFRDLKFPSCHRGAPLRNRTFANFCDNQPCATVNERNSTYMRLWLGEILTFLSAVYKRISVIPRPYLAGCQCGVPLRNRTFTTFCDNQPCATIHGRNFYKYAALCERNFCFSRPYRSEHLPLRDSICTNLW